MENYEFYKYINEKSMLVITPKNELKRLFCPFAVLDQNSKLHNVASIAAANDFKIYYFINGKYCMYSDFIIKC